MIARSGLLAGLLAVTGCDLYYFVCEPADDAALAQLPVRLSDTGLYADVASDELAEGVRAYTPQFELWSDGADKRRWVWLPPDARIDTSDMDAWRFPVGSKLWKEFALGDVRIETRLLEKVGPDPADWLALSYVWLADESDAIAAPNGFVAARGTSHNVPAAGECAGCHDGRPNRALGFSAIQLSRDPAPGELALDELIDSAVLSDPPPGRFAVPGDDTERAALGYLHANCGHCHNADRPARSGPRCYDPDNQLDFWLRVDGLASPQATTTYQSAIGFKVEPGQPDRSTLIDRISRRDLIYQMPPLGTEAVDAEAVALLRRWIAGLR